MFQDGWLINHSRWESQWKWDSFGALYVFKELFRGNLFDFGRLPVLSLLALLGAVLCIVEIRNRKRRIAHEIHATTSAHAFLLGNAAIWLLLFCGRPTWGVLFTMLGARDVQLHRLIGGVHAFSFFLIGIGLGTMWLAFANTRSKYRFAFATLLGLAILLPAFRERRMFLQQNANWSQTNLAALSSREQEVDAALASLKSTPGRTYPGLAATWGNRFRVGSVPFHAILSVNHIPAVSFLYHAMALTSDLMVWFDQTNPAHYRLFNVSAAIAPNAEKMPPFLAPKSSAGDIHLYQAPANGYFDLVRVPYAVRVYPEDFYDVSLNWIQSNWVPRLNHLLLDTDGKTGSEMPRLFARQTLPDVENAFDLGSVSSEKRTGEVYEARTEVERPGYLLFKMTYHSNWRAFVDGVPQRPVMLTPGFMGVPLNPGSHDVRFQYESGPLKGILLVLGAFVVLGVALVENRGGLDQFNVVIDRTMMRVRGLFKMEQRELIWTVLGLFLLSLPVCVPLFSSQLVSGHDAFSYVPRLVEFHENIRHGVLLPRWAPDLGNGGGQPLFLFSPPLIYYLAEIWYVLGFQATTAYNLACVFVVVASAVLMYLLGQLYFGRSGGWFAAAAYIYAPYFHVDLYVRQALAEFSAFPFYPLTLYGFGRFARDGDRRFLLAGALGIAGVFLAHNAAALLFAPILLAFILFNAWSVRSWKRLVQSSGGMALGMMLSAFVWLPILMEMNAVHIERLQEAYLNYSNHFVYFQQFFSPTWGFGLSQPGYEDGMSFSLGWPHVLLLVVALASARRLNVESRALVRFLAIVVAVYCFAMTPGALWLWDHVTLLQRVQFPWRMLGPISACIAIVLASIANAFTRTNRGACFALVVGSLIGVNFGHIGADRYYRLDPQDWTPTQIAQRGVSVTTTGEYEPRSVLSRPPYQPENFRILDGDAKVTAQVRRPTSWLIQINASRETSVEASLYNFPGWTASLDGAAIPIRVSVPTGFIQAAVPPGEHLLELELRRTSPRRYGEAISLIACVIVAAFYLLRAAR
jgi:hypothetical protein